jgi:hypothetical protein
MQHAVCLQLPSPRIGSEFSKFWGLQQILGLADTFVVCACGGERRSSGCKHQRQQQLCMRWQ